MKKKYTGYVLALTLTIVTLLGWHNKQSKSLLTNHKNITKESIAQLFPTTAEEIVALAKEGIKEAEASLSALIALENSTRTFANTIKEYDTIKNRFLNISRIIGVIPMIYPDQQLNETAQEQSLILKNVEVELFELNQKVFDALNFYATTNHPSEKLNADELYFLDYVINSFKKSGLNLPLDQQQQLLALKQDIEILATTFQKNIRLGTDRTVCVSLTELTGLPENFIKNLKRTKDGLAILEADYYTYITIIYSCSSSATREKLYKLFLDRSYPSNKDVLKNLIITKNKVAQLLGYESGAHLELSDTMAKTPENAEAFLLDLARKIEPLETLEFQALIKNLPADVKLSPEGTLYPWDRTYLMEQYKKNNGVIDAKIIAEYFPLEHTLDQLLALYEKFFSITFHREPMQGVWDQDLQLITIQENNKVIGHLILDLFSRPNKFHNSCHTAVITPELLKSGTIEPGVSLVLAHFARPQKNLTTLLTHEDVSTLFHEFGHALHALLGAAPFATLSGTLVKRDFVEVPSQMLEEWLWDKDILKKISAHYTTKKPLSDELIEKLIATKKIHAATNAQMQIHYSLMSLLFFKYGADDDLHDLFKKTYKQVKIHDFYCPDVHGYLSFNHFATYDAKYYTYVWSKVYALDLFETIKKEGLLNQTIGLSFKNTVLAPGGSKDPHELLKIFLGRPANDNAYLYDIGLFK